MALLSNKRRPHGSVGLDLDGTFLAAVQVDDGRVVRAVSADLPPALVTDGEVTDAAGLARVLKEFFSRHHLPRRVRLGVSNQQIVVRHLEVPRLEHDEQLDAAIRFQAQETIAMPLEEATLDYQVVGEGMSAEGAPTMRVLVVAARASMIDRFVEAVKGAGLRPEGIDLSAFALVRTFSSHAMPEEGAKVLCHLGGTTNLAVALARSCLFTRPLSTNWDEPGEHVAHALAEEIRLSIDFYMSQPDARPVEGVRLSGPGIQREELVEALSAPIGLPVEVAEPLGGVGAQLPPDEDPLRHTVATGLALGVNA